MAGVGAPSLGIALHQAGSNPRRCLCWVRGRCCISQDRAPSSRKQYSPRLVVGLALQAGWVTSQRHVEAPSGCPHLYSAAVQEGITAELAKCCSLHLPSAPCEAMPTTLLSHLQSLVRLQRFLLCKSQMSPLPQWRAIKLCFLSLGPSSRDGALHRGFGTADETGRSLSKLCVRQHVIALLRCRTAVGLTTKVAPCHHLRERFPTA